MTIHCIGDSHACVFNGKDEICDLYHSNMYPNDEINLLPYFKTYRLGSLTAFNLRKKYEFLTSVLDSIDLLEDDKIMFCFGSVDAECHLMRQTEIQNRSIEDIVSECVNFYMEVLLSIKQKYKNQLLVWNVVPSWPEDKLYDGCKVNLNLSNLIRNNVGRLFNQYLNDLCVKNGIVFVSIFDKLLNEDGTTNSDYILDHIHLNQKAMPFIIDELRKKSLIE